MFMHANFTHLFFNMFALWMFGNTLENFWGTKRFIVYYLACGLGAGLLTMLFPGSLTVGASGAVYGLLLAFGMTFPNEYIYLYFLMPIKAKWFVISSASIIMHCPWPGRAESLHFVNRLNILIFLSFSVH